MKTKVFFLLIFSSLLCISADNSLNQIQEMVQKINDCQSNQREKQKEIGGEFLASLKDKKIWPIEADQEQAMDGAGEYHSTTGENAASWFGYGGAGWMRAFSVTKGSTILLVTTGDRCPGTGAVIGDITFQIRENAAFKQIDGPTNFCGQRWYLYEPTSNNVIIEARGMFYLEVYSLPQNTKAIADEKAQLRKLIAEYKQKLKEAETRLAELESIDPSKFTGTTEAYATASITGKIDGKIVQLLFEKGDQVRRGQMMAFLDTQAFDIKVRKLTKAMAKAKKNLEESEVAYQLVAKDLERKQVLARSGVISNADLEASRAQFEKAKANVSYNKEELNRISIEHGILEQKRRDSQMLSPIAGIVHSRNYDIYQKYTAGESIYDVIDIDRIIVDVEVSQKYASQMQVGAKTKVTFPIMGDESYKGSVESLSPNSNGSAFIARVIVENPAQIITPGMIAEVHPLDKKR